MRAHEFIIENKKKPKISPRYHEPSKGLNLFAIGAYDRTYDLNRVMMAAAATDGSFTPELDKESWAGKYNTAHPYTEIDQEKLKQAYKAAGIPSKDLNKGDLESKELQSTNKKSPMKPFKGYKK